MFDLNQAAVDRMACDCGIELKKHNVTMISLYPGAVKTELVTQLSETVKETDEAKKKRMVRLNLIDLIMVLCREHIKMD